jgi:N6-adenosine-specific RNA methylase IME4
MMELTAPEKQYRTIVIDPPWPGPGATPAFDAAAATKRVPLSLIPYATMTGIQIASLRVPEFSTDDAQCFIWATTRGLGDAFLLLQGWGFKYRGLFVWSKPVGLGRHMRHDSEFLLWGGKRGAPLVAPKDCPPQTHHWPRRKHSEKPAEAYALIARLSPAPRIDIFARKPHKGFDAFGNELAND